MNFFEHQERARSNSRRMLVLFGLSVLAVVAAINAVVLIALGLAAEPGKDPQVSPAAAWTPNSRRCIPRRWWARCR